MTRCTATPPCNYKANGEVHDFGCPSRAAGVGNPELVELYVTETANERACLNAVLEFLLWEAGAANLYDPADVTGTDEDWIAVRRAIRDAHRHADLRELARGFQVHVDFTDGDAANDPWLSARSIPSEGDTR